MKKIMPLLIAIFFSQAILAQAPVVQTADLDHRTISVNGSASMEVVPDEIYVNIQLTEYQKKGEPKKDIETIKTGFLESCKSVGIADSLISIVAFSGSNNYYYLRKRKKDADLQSTITYQIKFKSNKMMDDLIDKLDDNATSDFKIESVSHSKIIDYRKLLKARAVLEAKEKAVYLAEAIGEKVGPALTINEPWEWQPGFYFDNAQISNNEYKRDTFIAPVGSDVDFKKIKLRYEVSVVFALK